MACGSRDQQTTWPCDSHRQIKWTFPIYSATAHYNVNVMQTAAKCDKQRRSASCSSYVIT